jgi:signal transduction histidine kinase
MQASAIAAIRRSILRTSFLLDGAALLLAIFVTVLSVLMLRRGIASLLSAGASAERRSAELERFAGRVAHDILSPLGAVQLALAFVERRTPGDVAVTNALARASRAITRVHRLVDGLLGYARAGARPDKLAVANVRDVVRDVVDGVAPEARVRGPEVLAVCCSQGVLTSVVSNLVQNAIKYIGAAPVRVVAIRATSMADDRVRVEVEDTGPGVQADAAASIFEPFVRGRSDAEGIGLGLATVRQLVHAHGGEVGVRSRPGEGSVFWAELPRATEPAHSQGA